jgi:VWFA-related protein
MVRLAACAILAATAALSQTSTSDPQTPTFQAGTRLVEIEVVVRNPHGPVAGLKKDDFTILDAGQPQRIDVFREGQAAPPGPPVPLPPGAVSNRLTSAGASASSVAGYTVVLYDQLNTRIDYKDYQRKALVKFIRGMGPQEHIAIYVLGSDLHVLQDFTDDPAKLIAALQHLDSGRDLMPANAHDALSGFETDLVGNVITPTKMPPELKAEVQKSTMDSAANVAQVYAARNDETTFEALSVIARHLAGMPGRRNLVWMLESPLTPMPFVGMLLAANIRLYPVLAHSLEFDPSGTFMGYMNNVANALTPGAGVPLATLMPDVMGVQHQVRQVAELTGGAGFGDAEDLQLAVKTAEEDSRSAYIVGFYPAEELLDGKYHSLTVKLAAKKSQHLEIRYRPGYLASKQILELPQQTTLADLFRNPLDASGLGLSGQSEPDSTAGLYTVRLTLDLHDLHLVREGGHSKGAIQLGFLCGNTAHVLTVPIDLTGEQLAAALRDGYRLRASAVPATGNAIRVAARDPSTGVAGSLTIPVKR